MRRLIRFFGRMFPSRPARVDPHHLMGMYIEETNRKGSRKRGKRHQQSFQPNRDRA